MVTKALKLVAVVAVVVTSVGVAGLFGPSDLEASGHSATRSFDVDSVGPGGHVEVSVSVSGLGAFGGVAETLPEGFTYEAWIQFSAGSGGASGRTDRYLRDLG